MKLFDRYLARAVILGTLVVLLVLIGLSGFISLIGQLNNVGTGTYQLADAFVYVALVLPRLTFELLPMAALLGALLGLGGLASHSELIVLRAAGVSVLRLCGGVAVAGLLLVVVAVALGELIAPPAEKFARQFRMLQLNASMTVSGSKSAWARDANRIISVNELIDQTNVGDVFIFELDENYRLSAVSRSASATYDADRGALRLNDVHETEFRDSGTAKRSVDEATRSTRISPELLGLAATDPDDLSLRGLHEYADYLRANRLDADRYVTVFWSRIARTVSVMLMAVLAVPFVFGPLRSSGAGQRLLVGALIGVAYVLASQLLANSGELYGLHPVLIAWLPAMALLTGLLVALMRLR